MKNATILTLAGFLFVTFFASLANAAQPWDLLIFSQNWPTSVCDNWMREKGKTCREYPKDIWTVHGIWPTKLGTVGPGFCDNNNRFRPNDITPIENELTYFWTPIHIQGAKTNFWSHEWNKHGTCATSINQLSNQSKYFNQGLAWAKKYNMANVLRAVGITPGREYTVQNIRDGVKRVLNVNPQILCYMNNQRQSSLLEVRLCFNKSLQLVDCDGTVVGNGSNGNLLTNCRTNKSVLYPQPK